MLRQLNSLGSGSQENVRTVLITSWKHQKNTLGEETQGKVKNRSLKGSALTKPKKAFLIFLCYDAHSAAVFLHSLNAKDRLRKQNSLEEISAAKIQTLMISILRGGRRQSRGDGEFSASLCWFSVKPGLPLVSRKVIHMRTGLEGC